MFAVVIPAAGSGSRMGARVPKVLLPIPDSETASSILRHTVKFFLEQATCIHVVVCVPPVWRGECERDLEGLGELSIVEGGDTRQESVRRGVEHLSSLKGVSSSLPVLVHDAARCCMRADVVHRVIQGVQKHGAVTAAVRVLDATCRVGHSGQIMEYVDRDSLWSVQTPQGFMLEDLVRAHRQAQRDGISALDDAALVARIRPVYTVLGDRLNIKVTEPGDLALVKAYSS